MSAPDDATSRIGNRYRLEQRIGAGAMGAVWRGTDELLNRTVAVKELLAAAEPPTEAGGDALEESRQRLMREGRIGARLQHPHVISMFDVVVHDDRPWLVMEYLPSRSLAAMLNEEGPLAPREVAEIGRQVADGLAAAHDAGVVHRDVKPGNVLIGEDGRVKLTDFGVSRAVDDVQLTRTGLIAGTPAFLSPEVARGQQPTAASDVFALGATLYAAVEGRPPFGLDDNPYALLHKVATGRPDPTERAGTLTALLTRLLADDPADRPTAAEARETLGIIADGRTGQVGTPSTGTAILDPGAVSAGAVGAATSRTPPQGRTAVASRDTRPADPEDTAAALPPAGAAPRPPAPDDGGAADGDGRGRRILLALLAAVAVVAVGVLAAVLTSGGEPPAPAGPAVASSAARAPAPAATPTATPTTAPAPSTTAPTTTTTTTETTTSAPPTSDDPPASGTTEPAALVQRYYGLLPGNTGAAWDLLGPAARAQSGGRGGFDGFYGGLRSVAAENVRGSGGGSVTATIVFVRNDGSTSREGYRFVVADGVIQSFSR